MLLFQPSVGFPFGFEYWPFDPARLGTLDRIDICTAISVSDPFDAAPCSRRSCHALKIFGGGDLFGYISDI